MSYGAQKSTLKVWKHGIVETGNTRTLGDFSIKGISLIEVSLFSNASILCQIDRKLASKTV